MKRFRIDFSIRETDCPPEEAQGIRFGDEVDVKGIFEFFNKCRDAAVTLFNGVRPKPNEAEDKLRAENAMQQLELVRLRNELERIKQQHHPHDQGPWEYRKTDRYRLQAGDRGIPDDGSRGGDGPPSAEFIKFMKEAVNPDRNRY